VTAAEPARRIPMRTLTSSGQAVDQDLHDGVYLDELDRQALIADAALTTAWQRGMTCTADDAPTWSPLQAALFAGIVVARILNPGDAVRPYPGQNKQQAKAHAQARGQRLRHRLGVDLSSPLFDVTAVRDSLEHFDERLDAALAPNPTNIRDWHITDGVAYVTPDAATAPGGTQRDRPTRLLPTRGDPALPGHRARPVRVRPRPPRAAPGHQHRPRRRPAQSGTAPVRRAGPHRPAQPRRSPPQVRALARPARGGRRPHRPTRSAVQLRTGGPRVISNPIPSIMWLIHHEAAWVASGGVTRSSALEGCLSWSAAGFPHR